jgi:hypothetical protein
MADDFFRFGKGGGGQSVSLPRDPNEFVRDSAFGDVLYGQWVPRTFVTTDANDVASITRSAKKNDILCFVIEDHSAVWQFLYYPDLTPDTPWWFIGGSPMHTFTNTNDNISSSTFVTATNGPSLTMPFGGVYWSVFKVQPNAPSVNNAFAQAAAFGDGTRVTSDTVVLVAPTGENVTVTSAGGYPVVGAGGTIDVRYAISSGNINFANRSLAVWPVRISG